MYKLTIAAISVATLTSSTFAQKMDWHLVKPLVSPPAIENAKMVFDDARVQIVLFGGSAGTVQGSTWLFDGRGWLPGNPTLSPRARYAHSMAWDADRKQVVLFGGFNGQRLNDTWCWDGKSWKEIKTATQPSPRMNAAMTYDGARKEIVLFGGDINGKLESDTWTFDGKTWRKRSVSLTPPGRDESDMVFDSNHGQIVLFGGNTASALLSDTWLWNGRSWKKSSPKSSPPARRQIAMVYDTLRKVVYLIGGQAQSSPVFLSDAWRWDGTTWTKEATNSQPSGRFGHALAYDSSRQHVVLFGGRIGSTTRSNETWVLHPEVQAIASKYGRSCGTFPGFRLDIVKSSLPAFGETFAIDALGLPPSSTAAVVSMGLSKTRFGLIPLPLKLDGLGMKGCELLHSFDFQWIIASMQGAGRLSLPVPFDTRLRGSTVYLQALGADYQATKLGLVMSNGIEATFGYR